MTTIFQQNIEVRNRLSELELKANPLREAIRQGYLAWINCTPNHPPLFPGIAAWSETVRALRENPIPLG